MSSAAPQSPDPGYSERLHVPVGWWIGVLGMLLVLGLEVVPLVPAPAWLTITVPVLLGALLLGSASLNRVQVGDGTVRAGKWSMDCAQVATVEELDARNTRRFAGRFGDPAAVALIRPWVSKSVRIICVTDDPPYALISSRRPERLSAAVVACATAAAEGESSG
ncbi:DUF3093 family protein [Cumulibacter manganitolerans]|uniref:DUF3093 family protein n=1 Tax=Cumulibacter manganitolerans TaxID=1884992 RepID=UPI001295C326|nr:DUF3093 family protein [Cumulibacter manganitolerans]